MSNAVNISTSTLSGGVLTFTFVVKGSTPIENFDLELQFLASAVQSIAVTGPSGWAVTPNTAVSGKLTVGGFTTTETPVATNGTLLTVAITLANPSATSLSLDYLGTFNAAGVLDKTSVALANGSINSLPSGLPTISGVVTEDQTLTAGITAISDADGVGTINYQWLRGGTEISGATAATYTLGDADVGQQISVRTRYTDGQGNAESLTSALTAAVQNINDAPTGSVTIAGTPTQGQTLSAAHTLADIDGLGTIIYQWKANGTDIGGATASTYTLTQAEVGKTITVVASYTDGGGTAESKTSSATTAVANINDAPTGSVTITGTPTQGQTLTASHDLADPDGLGTISYQWQANGTDIANATASTYTLTQAEVGKTITVIARYTDGQGTAESKTSSATATVANINDAPTGSVTITGTPTQGQALSASHTLADLDGLGTVTYQWQANGNDIAGATASSFTPTQAEVGKTITVIARYTDGQGTAESKTSSATAAVANINDAPTGNVTITGTPTQGQALSASHTLADLDGLGTVTYQWQANGTDITNATASTYTLTQAEVGKTITVIARYTDGQGTPESKASSATAAVANINDAPTGNVTITGTPTQGQALSASHTLADLDGLGTVTYQWQANGTDITNATASTYTLTQAEVGKTITVIARYTDGQGTAESKASSATTAVANINDAPTGSVTITGTPTQGQALSASHTLTDLDGLGTVTYQWQANGTDIAGATTSSFTPTQTEVGKTLTVKASYTDGQGTAESKTSSATASVANTNDAPTGAVTISGVAIQGQPLSAANTLADIDGLGPISYQWRADGTNINGASTATFTPTANEVGKQITVVATYTDGFGTVESKASTATAAVKTNTAPTGSVTINGTPTQGQTLSATHTLADAEGLGTVTYQWLANGINITGATSSTYTLTQAEVGKTLTVKASYTDGQGAAESKTSTATAAIANINDAPTGSVSISGTPSQGETLSVVNTLADLDGLGTITYQWLANATNISGATGTSYVLTQAEVGKTITVKASYTDGQGTVESKTSSATTAVANSNDTPTGNVTITGTATQGETLTASHTLADPDGLGIVTYQWQANGTAINGATASTYVPTQAEVGKTITVKASYTDGQGTAESKTSSETSTVANINDVPTGTVTITGTAKQGETLTASNDLADLDGLGTVTYQWQANGTAINGATESTYAPTQADVGKTITVKASYTDGQGTAESKASSETGAVANINDAPTGTVTITGTAKQGQTLTASNDLADPDGLGTIAYQWQANGTDIAGAAGASYVLTQAEVGKTLTVKASYTDGQGTAESKISSATLSVANINDAPTGTVTITGTAKQGQTLTASNDLADPDGLGTIAYQWQANGTDIAGAAGTSYVLTQAEVGKAISVKASYIDGQGTAESKTSSATAAVANINDAPTGAVTITGTAKQGQTLTAANNLADLDGLGTIAYQWQANGTDIAGATGTTFVLTQAEVGKTLTVKANYTDQSGTAESLTSNPTASVLNLNDAPTLSTPSPLAYTDTPLEDAQIQKTGQLVGQDADGDTLTYGIAVGAASVAGQISQIGSYGTLSISTATGGYTYQPNEAAMQALKANASEAFTLTASDGTATTNTTLTVNITGANDLPSAHNGSGTTTQNTALTANLTATDRDNDPLTFSKASNPGHGTVTVNANGSYTYTPATDYFGEDNFTFTVSDGAGSATGTVSLSIGDVDTQPSAADDSYSLDEDAILTIPATGILGNDSLGGDGGTLAATLVSNVQHGSLNLNANGSFTYTPNGNYHGTDNFSYSIQDSDGDVDTAQVALTIQSVNDAPQLGQATADQNVTVGSLYSLTLPEGAFTDADGNSLTYATSTLPGWLDFNSGTRTLSGAPKTSDAGVVNITITASDGALSATDTFVLTVHSLPPVVGKISDGYIAGASIYIDADADGVADPEEDTGVKSDGQGNFTVQSSLTGPLIALGGTNIDTGLPNTLQLAAPAGSTVINPLTTLVQQTVVQAGISVAAAETIVQTALGLTAEIDLTQYDPLAQATNDTTALAVQKAATQVATLATLAPQGDTTFASIAAVLQQAATPVDLTDTTVLQTILPDETVEVLAQVAAVNQTIASSENLTEIATTQEQALNDSNDAPVLNTALADQRLTSGVAYTWTIPAGNFSDVDAGDTLTYRATLADGSALPAWLTFDPASRSFSGHPENSDAGRLELLITASDSAGLTASDVFTLTTGIHATGAGGQDNLSNSVGDDQIEGLEGIDTVAYHSRLAGFTITANPQGYQLTDQSGAEGSDALAGIERLHFTDSNLAFDLDGNAGQAYRLYKAAFARTPDTAGLGGWIKAMDNGMSLNEVANAFVSSDEFNVLYGADSSNDAFVMALYLNALGRAPDPSEIPYWANQLNDKVITRAQMLAKFSESPENTKAVASLIAHGITYAENSEQTTTASQGLTLNGTENAETLYGSVGRDTFTGLAGDDTLNGGANVDTAVYSGASSAYVIAPIQYIQQGDPGFTVTGDPDGVDTTFNIERFKFSDKVLAFDLDGNAGQVYRLYQAAFHRTPDTAGLTDWVRGADQGMTLQNIAKAFIASQEFKDLYGANPSNDAFVTALYQNAMGRAPDEGGKAYWITQLDNGLTKEMALIGFSESTENQAAVIGVIQNGIELSLG